MDGGGCGRRSKEEDAGGRGPSASAQTLGFAGDAGMLLLLIYVRAAVRIRIGISRIWLPLGSVQMPSSVFFSSTNHV